MAGRHGRANLTRPRCVPAPYNWQVRAFRFGIAITLVGVAVALAAIACRKRVPVAVAGVPDVVDFNFHVKPLLSDRCFKCHGPDDRARKASLRLDVREVAFGELP